MNLVPLSIDSIHFGQPLPFVLRGADGALLAQRGSSSATGQTSTPCWPGRTAARRYRRIRESHRAYLAGLQRMLIADTNLGEIASMKMSAAESTERDREDTGPADWPALQERATQLLRSPQPEISAHAFRLCTRSWYATAPSRPTPPCSRWSISRPGDPAVQRHARDAGVLCLHDRGTRGAALAEARVLTLGRAALSMNVAMTELQDQLVQQAQPLTAAQIAAVESHAHRSEALLRQLGVADALWLEAVRNHHHRLPGPMADKTDAQQMARLIQRADILPPAWRRASPACPCL